MGRGKQTGSKEKFGSENKTIFNIPIHYAAFWHIPVVTHIIGALSLARIVRRLSRGYQGRVVVIAYNQLWHYLPSLFWSKIFGNKIYLDLEDGNTTPNNLLQGVSDKIRHSLFDHYCNAGALLAASSLKNQVRTKNTFVCYGCAEIQPRNQKIWALPPIRILFGGSLYQETGVKLLMDAISILESQRPDLKQNMQFTITGYGAMSKVLSDFSETAGKGWIEFLGDVDRDKYLQNLYSAHIGLCLKLSTSEMGQTTFPSKIIEYASYGLAIISTQVSDVPALLDHESAILLQDETPEHLFSIFQKIGEGAYDLQALGKKGQQKINSTCSSEIVGKNLAQFLMKDTER
ncbi:glycosyltransferase [bacterium]|nr:glycosyltransferase [bacterium]